MDRALCPVQFPRRRAGILFVHHDLRPRLCKHSTLNTVVRSGPFAGLRTTKDQATFITQARRMLTPWGDRCRTVLVLPVPGKPSRHLLPNGRRPRSHSTVLTAEPPSASPPVPVPISVRLLTPRHRLTVPESSGDGQDGFIWMAAREATVRLPKPRAEGALRLRIEVGDAMAPHIPASGLSTFD